VRHKVFVSHANPEDNDFSLWLSLQLMAEGYDVWCDLPSLAGGEDFWREVESVIRKDAAKVVFVVSRNSNDKDGTLKELHLATSVARRERISDFVIPIRIDDISFGEFNIELSRLNTIDFSKGWAAGLGGLLDKLQQDEVPRDTCSGPQAASRWWKQFMRAQYSLHNDGDLYLSNWFRIARMPRVVYCHHVGSPIGARGCNFPAYEEGGWVFSFADVDDLELGQPARTAQIDFGSFIDGHLPKRERDYSKTRRIVVRLLSMAATRALGDLDLGAYTLASGRTCHFFTEGFARNNRVSFTLPTGRSTFRQLVGYNSVRRAKGKVKRRWHYGIDLRPLLQPELAYAVTAHVLFSDDGKSIWTSKQRLHRQRRAFCRNWWNSAWRDRLLACVSWISRGEEMMRFPVSGTSWVGVEATPMSFFSPVGYVDPESAVAEDDEIGADDWDPDEVGDLDDEAADELA